MLSGTHAWLYGYRATDAVVYGATSLTLCHKATLTSIVLRVKSAMPQDCADVYGATRNVLGRVRCYAQADEYEATHAGVRCGAGGVRDRHTRVRGAAHPAPLRAEEERRGAQTLRQIPQHPRRVNRPRLGTKFNVGLQLKAEVQLNATRRCESRHRLKRPHSLGKARGAAKSNARVHISGPRTNCTSTADSLSLICGLPGAEGDDLEPARVRSHAAEGRE